MTKDHSILVTGGAGYIGSHVVLALREAGHSVVVVDDLSTGRRQAVPDDVPLVVGDVADEACVSDILARHSVNAVMLFAGSIQVEESVSNPLKYYRNNSSASRTLIEAAIRAGRLPLARALLSERLQQRPRNRSTWRRMARVLDAIGDEAGAESARSTAKGLE